MNEERDKALSDARSRLSSAEEKGMLKIIKNFLDIGMPIEEVAKHTPYSAEELIKIMKLPQCNQMQSSKLKDK